ncbi:NUDIX hydrolase [uncultured Paludibaculum sp.]|uniref:NUDIX hydrolase n=1 Tax=uncultured Paludibaculum sp. TaxID=1765020 RepID=UPI002AAAFF98|nr:NUDIX hydrolase [uncultured Paludibaculum sp.]
MSTRQHLIEQLRDYRAFNSHEEAMRARILAFVEAHDDCFERSLSIGHITASAWVLSQDSARTLLVHHARLDKWLQPGGHCDGSPDVLASAMREVLEETGVAAVLAHEGIFDVDAHDIPARKNEAAHVHYDVRFLLRADQGIPLVVSEESRAVAWVPLDEVRLLNTDESVLRLVEKTRRDGA